MSLIRTPPKLTNRNSLVKYVEVDLWSWLKTLSTGFFQLNFSDNFQSFLVSDISIPANTEIFIPNQFKTTYPGIIPTGRIIVRQQGDANIIDGVTPWTVGALSLRNPSANDAVVSVLFFK